MDLNALQAYVNKAETKSLPDTVVLYMDMLEMVRALYSKYETKTFIINILTSKTYNLSRHQAHKLYYDALNFFFADNKVKQVAWKNIYAQRLDDLAYYSIEIDDIESARRCFMDAATLRGVGKEEEMQTPDEMRQRPVVIYTIDAEKAGIEKANRTELAQFIDNIPEISERERVRLQRDSGITEVTLFEEIIDEKGKGK